MDSALTRRQWLGAAGAALLFRSRSAAAAGKPMEGAFIIAATPYTEAKAIDYEDLAGEVAFLNRAGVQGIVWPQMASEYPFLNEDERMRGMEVLAKANQGRKAALVLGVQADNEAQMLKYAKRAEKLEPDAVIAMPPKQAESLDDFRSYYSALCKVADRPVFIQTTGGAKGIEPTVEFIVEMAEKHPNFGYVKEEYEPVFERLQALAARRPEPIKAVFGGSAGRGWTHEMRYGFDGTMPGAMFADVYALLWELHKKGDRDRMREVFSKLLLLTNLDRQIPGVRNYAFQRRGIFKTMVSRRGEYAYSPEQKAEMEWCLAGLAPYFRIPLPPA